ncbi:hypothetical protein [Methylobacterium durans]|uniref:Uncharacterized protein n=1 Tax=Methylobacterium durans TaxID=2202825 RepID=A0A2U8WCY4_9HYPH|nr:hypothetical protein [Methylobacterium durans]AWN43132.1 hypothetical protein DK389_24870 [Methylobacterium durans]
MVESLPYVVAFIAICVILALAFVVLSGRTPQVRRADGSIGNDVTALGLIAWGAATVSGVPSLSLWLWSLQA